MKRIITIIIITILMLAAGVAAGIADMRAEARTPLTNGEHYALTTKVVALDEEQGVVTCEDYNGNLWEFCGGEDWEVGDCASLLMNTRGTLTIYDDEVQGARYGGYTITR